MKHRRCFIDIGSLQLQAGFRGVTWVDFWLLNPKSQPTSLPAPFALSTQSPGGAQTDPLGPCSLYFCHRFLLLLLKVCTENYTEYSCATPASLPCHSSERITHHKPVLNLHDLASSSDAQYSVELQLPEAGDYKGISMSSVLP